MIEGRCGTCRFFPGNGRCCSEDLVKGRKRVHAMDYGKGHCRNYLEG